ncbi:MAG: hypothetical protein EXQ85_05675 [Alphaproteobacteria bacterium]|nr:hypothetical protein [Alphaproteobacteria bacterium]
MVGQWRNYAQYRQAALRLGEMFTAQEERQAPAEFFSRFGGCEDFAIAKYLSLASAGFDTAKLRVVVVQDLNLKGQHAVLAVEFDGKSWILDNQIKQVIEADKIKHYRPIYSVNDQAWWLHKAT